MECAHFGTCNACVNYEGGYDAQLARKIARVSETFSPLYTGKIECFESTHEHFRDRVEFRVFHEGDTLHLALTDQEKRFFFVKTCDILSAPMYQLIGVLPELLARNELLKRKLFGLEMLSNGQTECVVNLVYHKELSQEWEEAAQTLANTLNISVIGRSKGQKRVVGDDYVTRHCIVNHTPLTYRIKQNCFSQPNGGVNEQMLNWAYNNASGTGDLLEMYCGSGNFTMALAGKYRTVFATEMVKEALDAARHNKEVNHIDNLYLARLNAQEVLQALNGEREFRRLHDIDCSAFDFHATFVDPPRAGLGTAACEFTAQFDEILYISCNESTLKTDLEQLCKTHTIDAFAVFDQFAYTNHIECGVKLVKKGVIHGM